MNPTSDPPVLTAHLDTSMFPRPSDTGPVLPEHRALLAELFGDALPELDALAATWTASPDLAALVVDPGGVKSYRPSLRGSGNGRADRERLADAYDRVQEARGDDRRAF